MSNGAQCCALEICCPPQTDGSPDERAVRSLAMMMAKRGIPDAQAEIAARAVLLDFELADRGTLTALKASMVQHAKHA